MSFRFTRSKKETSLVLGLLLSLAPVPFIAGCKDEDKNTKQPVLPTVQVNPIVVLKPGEQIGGPSNGGSRLSKAQMTDHLNSLNGFARKHWKFQISYPMQGGLVDPLVFEDQQLIAADLPFNGRDARKFEIAEWLFNSLPNGQQFGPLEPQ